MTQQSSPGISDVAIVNARVYTGDARRPWADAVLVREGRIEAIGSSADIRKRAGSLPRIVDAKRRMLARPLEQTPADPSEPGSEPLGTLQAGNPADLMLLDREIPPAARPGGGEARVVLRISGGRVTFDPDGLTR